MKKRLWTLALALLFAVPVCAEELRDSALGLLTEVYGYTAEESRAFRIEEDGDQARFFPADHPDWVYTLRNDDGELVESTTPFSAASAVRGRYPGENTVRQGMRLLRDEWLPAWNNESRAQMIEWLKEGSIFTTARLRGGLQAGTLSAQDAVREFLVSCYGELGLWPKALREWESEVLGELNLPAPSTRTAMPERGVVRWEAVSFNNSKETDRFVRFVGETPEELETVLSASAFDGWTLLCGALYKEEVQGAPGRQWAGLIAFEQNDRRWLVGVTQDQDGRWRADSLGENSLYPDRDFWIENGSLAYNFDIVYPLSEDEAEWFTIAQFPYKELATECSVKGYTRRNMTTGEGIAIEADPASSEYQVALTAANGNPVEEKISQTLCVQMPLMPLNDFPTTLEACRENKSVSLPEGYGYTSGVHLREKTSSRSRDLGEYNAGTLVQVLGREPGDPYDWYHVRVGRAEGYMSSAYVTYDGNSSANVIGLTTPPAGEAVEAIRLRDGTGWFAKTVEEVPKGTRMHILAQCGDWLHVMIPQGELESIMDVNGTDGYVKEDEIKRVSLTRISTGE